jgi:hypothetical protein
MVTVIKQPRWAFKTYEEVYEFDTAVGIAPLLERITEFYLARGARGIVREPSELRFSRGSVFGSLFLPIERYHKQDVSVGVTEQDDKTKVVCHYKCWDPYPNYHTPPRTLQREVERLEVFVRQHEYTV